MSMNTTNESIPLRVVNYPSIANKVPIFQLVIHENPSYSKDVLDKYIFMLAKCVESRQDICQFFKEKELGYVWGEIILGAIAISPSGKIEEYGDTRMSMGYIKYGNEKCSAKDIPGLTLSVPILYSPHLSFLRLVDVGKIKDVLWYLLIGVSTYYVLTELIKLLF